MSWFPLGYATEVSGPEIRCTPKNEVKLVKEKKKLKQAEDVKAKIKL